MGFLSIVVAVLFARLTFVVEVSYEIAVRTAIIQGGDLFFLTDQGIWLDAIQALLVSADISQECVSVVRCKRLDGFRIYFPRHKG